MCLDSTLRLATLAGAIACGALACREAPEQAVESEREPAPRAQQVAPSEEPEAAPEPGTEADASSRDPEAAAAAPDAVAREAERREPKPVRRAATKEAPAADDDPQAFDGRRLALAHTSNVMGELEPCG